MAVIDSVLVVISWEYLAYAHASAYTNLKL